jgi:hypothetical protein
LKLLIYLERQALRVAATYISGTIDTDEYIADQAESNGLMLIVEQSKVQTEPALAGLRRSFDERLSALQSKSAASRLQSAIRGRAKLSRKVKADSRY